MKNNLINKNKINIYKKILFLSLPVTFENLITTFVNFVDVFMVGADKPELGLGKVAIAGIGSANQIFFILVVSLFGLFSGANILTAQFFGNKNYEMIKKITSLTITLGVLFSIPFFYFATFQPELLIRIYSTDPEVILNGSYYLRIIGISYPIFALAFAISMQLRGIGKAKYSLYASIAGVVINIILNYILIEGHFGIPAFGIKGAAIATLTARTVSTIYLITIIKKYNLPIIGNIKDVFTIKKEFIIKFLKISTTTLIHEIIWVIGTSSKVMIYGRIGTLELASIQIVTTISSIAFTMFSGLSNATSIIIGNEIGSENEENVMHYSDICINMMLGLGFLTFVLLNIFSPMILNIMRIEPQLVTMSRTLLMVEAVLVIFKSLSLIFIVGILRSGGDVMYSLVIELVFLWGISIPLVYIGGLVFHLPIYIVYILSVSDDIIKIIPAYIRYRSKKWIKSLY